MKFGGKMKRRNALGFLLAVTLGIVPLVSSCSSGGVTADTQIKTNHNPVTLAQIANIQPGLGTIMIEYTARMNNLWFAAQQGNWDMVRYQIDEMKEIQEVGEITRSNRAGMLKAFESSFLSPLDSAAHAKDLTAFSQAYDNTVGGCNGCHAASSSSKWSSYRFVKITRPTTPSFNNVDWAAR
jgi:hypothetical protein